MSLTFKTIEDDNGKKLDKFFQRKSSLLKVKPSNYLVPPHFVFFATKIRDMEIYNDDVWTISYPRTGSNWIQKMIWCIGNDYKYENAKVPLTIRAPLLEASTLMTLGRYGDSFAQLGNSVDNVEKASRPRYVKSNLPLQLLPQQLREKKPKIIYVARNPKDTCVSYYHYCKRMNNIEGTFEHFAELFLNDTVPMGPFHKHVLELWTQRNDKNILFLTYEEMKRNKIGVIQRAAEFLGKKCTDIQAEELAKHLEFAKITANPAINRESIWSNNDNYNQDDQFIRKGIIGDWQNHMNEELAQKFDDWTEKHFKGAGLFFYCNEPSGP